MVSRASPGTPGEAIDGAVTLRTIAEHPEGFTHLLLTEHHAAKPGSVDRSVEDWAMFPVATWIAGDGTATCPPYHDGAARLAEAAATSVDIVSGRGGGGRESNPPEAQRASRRC